MYLFPITFFQNLELSKLKGIVDVSFAERHGEYDFGSYKKGFFYLKKFGLLDNYDELILCNDSCYGPVSSFVPIFTEMASRDLDFWGLTQNSQFKKHLQSYFLVFKSNVARTKDFETFMANVKKEENVQGVILNYEINFTILLEHSGFIWDSFIKVDDSKTKKKLEINSNLTVFPVFLAESDCQLIKVKAMKRANCNYDGIFNTSQFIHMRNKGLYDCIDSHIDLRRYSNPALHFSIIIPAYNRAHVICEAIDSALHQNFSNFEIVVVNDGSTDDTKMVIEGKYQAELATGKIIYVHLPRNGGVSAARNVGLQVAKNPWICYLDSDNRITWPHFLTVFADSICENNDVSCLYASFMRLSTGTVCGEKFDYSKLLRENFIDSGIFVHHANILSNISFFDTGLKRLVDWDFIVRATKNNTPVFVPITVMNYNDCVGLGDRVSVRESYNDALVHIRKKYKTKFLVSTVIITYNHEDFVRQAIESACNQKGDFDHEVFIFDDCSTDSTWSIIGECALKFPDLIKGCRQEKNIGQAQNLRAAFGAARGDFIAVLEGDDSWSDLNKVHKQSQFLIANSDCSMVFSKIEVHDIANNTKRFLTRQSNLNSQKLDGADFLAHPSMNLIANFSCCMYRRHILDNLPDYVFDDRVNEIAVAFYFENFGKIGYVNEAMTVYRQHLGGMWTGASKNEQEVSALAARKLVKKLAKKCWQAEIERDIEARSLRLIEYA